MTAIREALEAAGIPFERPKPSETWECLKIRDSHVHGAAVKGHTYRTNGRQRIRKYTATHQQCALCDEWKPLDAFTPAPSQPSGCYGYCRACANARRRAFAPHSTNGKRVA